MMINREEAISRIKKLEKDATEAGDRKAALCYVKAYNAVMSCRVIRKEKKDGGDQDPDLPEVISGQINILDFNI